MNPSAPYCNCRINLDALFSSTQPLNIARVEFSSLVLEDNLLNTSVHRAHHGYQEELSRYYETVALIIQARSGMDWQRLIVQATSWKVILPLWHMLTKIEALWRQIIPAPVIDEVKRLNPSWSERTIDHYLTHNYRSDSVVILLSIFNTPGLIVRARFFIETTIPSPVYQKHYFSPGSGRFWLLLYLKRLFRFMQG